MVQELVQQLITQFGLLGLFVAAIVANATIFFPVPIDIFVFALGATDFLQLGFFTSLIVGFIVGSGAAVGELSGYIIGLAGVKSIEKLKNIELKGISSIGKRIEKRGMIFIFLGALTPFPFDIIGLAAGLIKYNLRKFFIATMLGKIVRYFLIAFSGLYSIGIVKSFFGF